MSHDQGWIGIDLDGCLARYDGWHPDGSVGAPVPAMAERVRDMHAAGHEIRIFTARVAQGANMTLADVEVMRARVQDWCELHLGFRPQVTNVKDHKMIALFDDRAVQVEPNTGRILGDLSCIKGLPAQVFDL